MSGFDEEEIVARGGADVTVTGPRRSYDWARIVSPGGTVLGGAVLDRHADGTCTISLGGMVPVRGPLHMSEHGVPAFVRRNDGLPSR